MRLLTQTTVFLASLLLAVQSAVCNAGYSSTRFEHPADVEVDLSVLKPGAHIVTSWNDHPVLIYRRTRKDIQHLKATFKELADPYNNELAHHLRIKAYMHGNAFASAVKTNNEALTLNPLRAINEEYLVVDLISSYIGCAVMVDTKASRNTKVKQKTLLDPCRDVKYDLSGRVLKGHKQNANLNLLIMPHRFESPHRLVIGIGQNPVPAIDFRPYIAYHELPPTQRLITAAQFGELKQVITAVQAGADINAKDDRGVTALFMAVSDVDSGVSEWLLQNGANPNIRNSRGGSPSCTAVMGGNEKTIKLLGRYGANWELEDKSDPNCEAPRLIWAITNTSSEEFSLRLVRALVEAGANPRVTYQGKSAIDYAKKEKYQKVVEHLTVAITRTNQQQ